MFYTLVLSAVEGHVLQRGGLAVIAKHPVGKSPLDS